MKTTAGRLSRRSLLGAATAIGAIAGLAGCGPDPKDARALKFWNMPNGGPAFEPLDRKIVESYSPADGLLPVTYQQIQWTNFTQTFATAVASKTGPAVSAGGGTQAFQYAEDGAIAYADNLLESWKDGGLYDDFLPGLLDTMKTPSGYVAVPYNLDMRALWYNSELLEKAEVGPPESWQDYLDAAAALKKIGVYGFTLSGNANGGSAFQTIVGVMINNGGGIFDEDQQPNLLTQENIEALDFVQEIIAKGYLDPGAISYTSDNVNTQWKAERYGLGFDVPGLASNVGGSTAEKLRVGDPLTSANGTQGAIYFPNNLMMYTESPSIEGAEAFLTYYYRNMAPLWTQKTGIGLPVLSSIVETKEFRADPNQYKLVKTWQPICKTWAAPGGDALFAMATKVDSTPAMTKFGQDVMSGQSSRESLSSLQKTLEAQFRK